MDSGARLKIKRADKHISDVESRISKLMDSYTVSVKPNPRFGTQIIEHDLTDRNAGVDLAPIIGDAIHNLHSALDHAWFQCVERFTPDLLDRKAKFPVHSSLQGLEGDLKGRKIKMASAALYDLMVSKIKPYHGGNHDLWTLHKLDIDDKHRVFVPVVNLAAVEGIELYHETRSGETIKDGWTMAQPPPVRIDVPVGYKIKNHGKFTAEVVFDEGTPAYSLEVADTLQRYSRFVTQAVEAIEVILG